MKNLKNLNHYPKDIISQIQKLISYKKLDKYLLNKYKTSHDYKNDKVPFISSTISLY
ncbi:MAG: hypothetical protein WA916_09045 [Arcobacter sp.]